MQTILLLLLCAISSTVAGIVGHHVSMVGSRILRLREGSPGFDWFGIIVTSGFVVLGMWGAVELIKAAGHAMVSYHPDRIPPAAGY